MKNQLIGSLDRVGQAETNLIMDRGRPVARIEPVAREGEGEEFGRLAHLERGGILRRAASPARSRLRLEPPPRPLEGASLLQALLVERGDGR